MQIKYKIFWALGMVMLILMGSLMFISYRHIEKQIYSASLNKARDLHALIEATRRTYQHQFLDSGLPLTEKTIGFLPAHSLSRIADDFKNWSSHHIRFNAVSDRPRNPLNKANPIELEDMNYFRANPNNQERMRLQSKGGEIVSYYQYSRPIWIEQYCLQCHGTQAQAPKAIQERYDQSYDYQVGELRGLTSIQIPIEEQFELAYQQWKMSFIYIVPIFVAIWFLLSFAFKHLIASRLEKIQTLATSVGQGQYDIEFNDLSQDEIGETMHTINGMVKRIASRERSIRHSSILYKILSQTNELLLREVKPNNIFEEIAQILVEQGEFNLVWVANIDESSNQIEILAHKGKSQGLLTNLALYEPSSAVMPADVATYIKEGRSVIINDLNQSKLLLSWQTQAQSYQIHAIAFIPFLINNQVQGFLSVGAQEKAYFVAERVNLLQEVCRDVAFAIDINQKSETYQKTSEQVNYISLHDPLTNLPNLLWLQPRLQQVIAGSQHHGHIGAILYIDLDNFKLINDSLG